MEDKLIKTNHKVGYYYFKKVSTCFAIFLVASVAVAIPVSIAASIRESQKSKDAELKETEKNNEQLKLLSFN